MSYVAGAAGAAAATAAYAALGMLGGGDDPSLDDAVRTACDSGIPVVRYAEPGHKPWGLIERARILADGVTFGWTDSGHFELRVTECKR